MDCYNLCHSVLKEILICARLGSICLENSECDVGESITMDA